MDQRYCEAFRARLDAVRNEYQKLERDYHALTLHQLRNLSLPLAPQRFLCAALLQHNPSQHGFLHPSSFEAEANDKEPCNEVCPVWKGWFGQTEYAEETLSTVERYGTPFNVEILEDLISTAEAKTRDVTTMLTQLSTLEPKRTANPDEDIFTLWNSFCWCIRHGYSIEYTVGLMYTEGNTWADPVSQDSTAHSWRKWFDFELYGVMHVPGSWYNEIITARPQLRLTAVQRPMPSQIRGYKKDPGEKDIPAPPSDSRHPNTPRVAPSAAADFPTIFTEYIARWDSLAPHEVLFPLPSVDFRIQGLQDRQQFGELTRLVNIWDDDTVMKANAFRFFAESFELDMTVKVVSGKTHLHLVEGQAEDSELQTLLKHLKRMKYFRWHPDKINLRTGHPGVLNEQIGKQDAVVAVRSAMQELIEECERLLG